MLMLSVKSLGLFCFSKKPYKLFILIGVGRSYVGALEFVGKVEKEPKECYIMQWLSTEKDMVCEET